MRRFDPLAWIPQLRFRLAQALPRSQRPRRGDQPWRRRLRPRRSASIARGHRPHLGGRARPLPDRCAPGAPALHPPPRRDRAEPGHRSRGRQRAAGPRRMLPASPARRETPFNIFSASKAITAMVIHKLDEERLLHLEDRVCEYIPEFARHGKDSHHDPPHPLASRRDPEPAAGGDRSRPARPPRARRRDPRGREAPHASRAAARLSRGERRLRAGRDRAADHRQRRAPACSKTASRGRSACAG